MKKLVSIFVFLFFIMAAYPQLNKNHLNFSAGAVMPVGIYANKDIQNTKSGIAQTGITAQLAYTRLFKKNYGVAASLIGLINPVDSRSMEQSFNQTRLQTGIFAASVINPLPVLPPGNLYPNWQFMKSSWKMGALLLGGYAEYQAGKNIFTLKTLLGAVYAASPKIDGSSITDTASAFVKQTKASAFGFGYSAAAGLKIRLCKKISFITTADYLGTGNLVFKSITATITTTKGSPSNPGSYSIQQMSLTGNAKQLISVITLSAGLSIEL